MSGSRGYRMAWAWLGVALVCAAGARTAHAIATIRTDRGIYAMPAPPALPAAGGTVTDPTFGTRILRVTDAADGASNYTAYSYWPTFNANSTRFHINVNGVARLYSFNPETFQITGKSNLWQGTAPAGGYPGWEDAIWSATDPNVIYGHSGLKLYSYNVVSRTYTLVKDFATEFPGGSGVGSVFQMSKSLDDQRFAFTLKAPAPSYADVGYVAWDRPSNTVLLQQTTTQLDEVQLDKTGQYLLIKTGQQGASAVEARVADLSTGLITDLKDGSPDYAPGHSDSGHGTVIGADNWRNAVTFRTLASPHQQSIILSFGSDWSQDYHISMLADDEHWALLSTYDGQPGIPAKVFHNEIFMIATDGSGDVLRLAHDFSAVTDYWDTPRANVSRDGRFVAFTSTWGNTGREDVFILAVPEAGDANMDGKVDGADLALWQQNYDPLETRLNNWAMGDWNGDGKVDGADLALWQRTYNPLGVFGLSDGLGDPASLLSEVPEPATLLLLGPGLLLLLRGKRNVSRAT